MQRCVKVPSDHESKLFRTFLRYLQHVIFESVLSKSKTTTKVSKLSRRLTFGLNGGYKNNLIFNCWSSTAFVSINCFSPLRRFY